MPDALIRNAGVPLVFHGRNLDDWLGVWPGVRVLLLLLLIPTAVALEPHEPIRITEQPAPYSPADDVVSRNDGIRAGSGTVEDPFVISGWKIAATGREAVYIDVPSSHWVIENLDVAVAEGQDMPDNVIRIDGASVVVRSLHVQADERPTSRALEGAVHIDAEDATVSNMTILGRLGGLALGVGNSAEVRDVDIRTDGHCMHLEGTGEAQVSMSVANLTVVGRCDYGLVPSGAVRVENNVDLTMKGAYVETTGPHGPAFTISIDGRLEMRDVVVRADDDAPFRVWKGGEGEIILDGLDVGVVDGAFASCALLWVEGTSQTYQDIITTGCGAHGFSATPLDKDSLLAAGAGMGPVTAVNITNDGSTQGVTLVSDVSIDASDIHIASVRGDESSTIGVWADAPSATLTDVFVGDHEVGLRAGNVTLHGACIAGGIEVESLEGDPQGDCMGGKTSPGPSIVFLLALLFVRRLR